MSISDTILTESLKSSLGSNAVTKAWAKTLAAKSLESANESSISFLNKLRGIALRFSLGDGNSGDSRAELIREQESLGMPTRNILNEPDAISRIQNISSKANTKLQVQTIRSQAKSLSQLATSENPVLQIIMPAWRLVSTAYRSTHRDWASRWQTAGASVGWEGASQTDMVALKTSPIWQALGTMFTDSLGQAYPPFAFMSSYGWTAVKRDECIRLGLIEESK